MSSLNPEPDRTLVEQIAEILAEHSGMTDEFNVTAREVLGLPEIRRALTIAATWDEMNEMGRRPASDAAAAKRYNAAKDRLLSLRAWL